MKLKFYLALAALFSMNYFFAQEIFLNPDSKQAHSKKQVHKYVLDNGMTILIVPNHFSSEVAMFLWYNVGSKHEGIGERGMAHFIEHMIFKGTHEMLSETDIGALEGKLTAYANAFTYYDYTAYVFKLPEQNWEKILPVFADCMQNCRFRQDHMDSEVKAVVQELDMRRDKHAAALTEAMAASIFDGHPYHYNVIGFKQDLCRLRQDSLVRFYKKQYIPQNATLVLVGNLDPDQAFEKVSQHFNAIARGQDRSADNFYFYEDVQTQSVTLYRDVQQPVGALAFVIPGLYDFSDKSARVLKYLLTDGMSSRLYKKLVEEHKLVSSLGGAYFGTFEKNIFYILYVPKKVEDIAKIKELILQELEQIIDDGFEQEEFNRAVKLAQVAHQSSLESVYNVGYKLGLTYLVTGDEHALFEPVNESLYDELMALLKRYFRRAACHEGYVFKVPEQDQDYFQDRMQEMHEMSSAMLAQKERESQLESARYANSVVAEKFANRHFPEPETFILSNGLEVLLFHSKAVDLVKCVLSYKANSLYDTPGCEGMGDLVSKMILEGTKDLPGLKFVETIGSYGISFVTAPGKIWACMLPEDTKRGLEFLKSMVTDANFDEKSFEKIKTELLAELKEMHDDAQYVLRKAVTEIMYQQHPYGRIASADSVSAIDRDICFDFYKKYLSAQGARLVIVGNYDKETIKQTVKEIFESWQGEEIAEITYPEIQEVEPCVTDIVMNRDQVYLAFFAPSVALLHPDYDYLNLFNKMLHGSWDTFLMELREQTGLFYTIGGSLVSGAAEQPGIVCIKTMVAPDRVQEAQEKIVEVMTKSVDWVTDEKFEHAKEQMIHEYIQYYESLNNQADTFIWLKRYNLPFNYFEKQIDKIRAMCKEDMQKVVKKYVQKDKLSCIRVGKF